MSVINLYVGQSASTTPKFHLYRFLNKKSNRGLTLRHWGWNQVHTKKFNKRSSKIRIDGKFIGYKLPIPSLSILNLILIYRVDCQSLCVYVYIPWFFQIWLTALGFSFNCAQLKTSTDLKSLQPFDFQGCK